MTARRVQVATNLPHRRPIQFRWNGRLLSGLEDDSVAAALLANNVNVVGRSFKYHRPRGVMSAGVEESGALVTVGSGARREVNVKATMVELTDGLEVSAQNAWPSVRWDLGEVNNLLARFFAAGFYYKTFMGLPPFESGRGTGVWMKYEKLIRKAAGMGRVVREADPDDYDQAHGFCDVLVIGSGPAGRAAAMKAASTGLDVWLVEQDVAFGGSCLSCPIRQSTVSEAMTELKNRGVRCLRSTTAFGLYDHGVVGLLERVGRSPREVVTLPRERFWTLRCQHIVVATGAIERPLVFRNNDRPGVMTASAGASYLNRYGILLGQNIVIATNNDSAFQVALQLQSAGANVRVLDTREELQDSTLVSRVRSSGVTVYMRCTPLNVNGWRQIKSVDTAVKVGKEWRQQDRMDCDLLLLSGGWSPTLHLLSHRGVKPKWDPAIQAFVAHGQDGLISLVGSAAGVWQHDACVRSAIEVAGSICEGTACDSGESVDPIVQKSRPEAALPENPIDNLQNNLAMMHPTKSFVDFQHDVTAADIHLASREGFTSVEHMKRYTTLGMATDQGKVGNVMGIVLLAAELGVDIENVGITTFRPPYTPISIGALAGRQTQSHFRPLRRTPLHQWNLAQGATMIDAGLWHRPWYFAAPNESLKETYTREAATARESVGVCDVTSLGKIALQGPDVAEFLNRVYVNNFASLPVGKARYGLMLRDDGMVLDDGTTWRLSDHDYLMTTTTAHAAKVMVWLEELLQCRWPELRVCITSVTDQWAGISIAGPNSREVLGSVLNDPQLLAPESLPFMGVCQAQIEGIDVLVARISFSGELAFELYVPSDFATAMMERVWEVTQQYNGCLYGLEALGTLRIEKGHVTGAELDGNVSLEDAGFAQMASKIKPFVGSTLKQREALQAFDRPQLIGIVPRDRTEVFNAGSLLMASEFPFGHGQGWVTGVTESPALGHWIGLGFIRGGHAAWLDKPVICRDPLRKGDVDVDIVSPHLFDPDGERLNGTR